MSVDFVLALRHRVADLEAASGLLVRCFDFEVRERGDGWMRLENGALVLRLLAGAATPAPRLELELVSADLPASIARLTREPGIDLVAPAARVRPDRDEARISTRHGLDVVLVRHYDEDELGIVPDLPVSLVWSPAAVALLQEALREVPITFRAGARNSSTAAAETLALEQGSVEVSPRGAALGLFAATPALRKAEVAAWLAERGHAIDPSEVEAR